MTNLVRCLSDKPYCRIKFAHVHNGDQVWLCLEDGKYTKKQEDLIHMMHEGFLLTKHRIFCGNPSTYTLTKGNASEFADKRTVNSLIKRGVLVSDSDNKKNTRFSYIYKLVPEKL